MRWRPRLLSGDLPAEGVARVMAAAVEALAIALQDPSPALQYRAMESLKKVSGRDLGHDVVAWRNFIESAAPPSPTPREGPSLVERFQDRF